MSDDAPLTADESRRAEVLYRYLRGLRESGVRQVVVRMPADPNEEWSMQTVGPKMVLSGLTSRARVVPVRIS